MKIATTAVILTCFLAVKSFARPTADDVKKSGKLGIPLETCRSIENKIGQLLFVNVDGYGGEKKEAMEGTPLSLSPAYGKMIEDLQIGGVLPKFTSWGATIMTREAELLSTMRWLRQRQVRQPLLIGVDYLAMRIQKKQNESYTFVGLGVGSGFLGRFGGKDSPECLQDRAFLDAFLNRTAGVNLALGPTIENDPRNEFLAQSMEQVVPSAQILIRQFDKMGISTTLKHYPYTPSTYNLHDKSEDTKIPKNEVMRKLQTFHNLNQGSDFVMSTHLYNSNVDPADMATFSKEWVRILREEIGFKGLLMTDALFMIDKYSKSMKQMSSHWPHEQVPLYDENSQISIFAMRAILAGHDIVMLESTMADTYRVFKDILFTACQDKPISATLRARISESYSRIVDWKTKNRDKLLKTVEPSNELIEKAIQLHSSKDLCQRADEMNVIRPQIEALLTPAGSTDKKNPQTPEGYQN